MGSNPATPTILFLLPEISLSAEVLRWLLDLPMMSSPDVRLHSWRLHAADIPYRRPVRWSKHEETSVACVILEVRDQDGHRGAGELCIRPQWLNETAVGVVRELDAIVLPALKGQSLSDPVFLSTVLATAGAASRALVDAALHDLEACAQGVPLWRLLGAGDGRAAVSCTITRAPPAAMAREAEDWRARHGVEAFKIKTGQGYQTDREALAAIRSAIGDDVSLSVDSNSADTLEDAPRMIEMAHGFGVGWFEDPCRLVPDDAFADLQRRSPLPILVDNACRSLERAGQFIERGARGLSVKLFKTGISQSRAVMDLAASHGVQAAIGISASASLGAIHSLALSAAMPAHMRCMPCEETFFLNLAADVLREPLRIVDGEVHLPDQSCLADLLDWPQIMALSPANGV